MSTLTASRVTGRAATVTGVVRIVVGAFFVLMSLPKFPFTGSVYRHEVDAFVTFGFPESSVELFVLAAGIVELVAGVLLLVGFVTRAAALALAAVMIGAIATAGLQVGGAFHLGFAPTLLVILIVLAVVGAGAASIDKRIA